VSLVVDASVVIKWFAAEELMEEADRLRPLLAQLVAPDFCLVELANIAWKKMRRGTFLPDEATQITSHLRRSGMRFLPSGPLLDAALRLAREFDHPVYDCFYITTMDQLGAAFVTWDRPLHAKLARSRFAVSTYLLSEVDRLLVNLNGRF
jgi:predicted nucleic acid-binding protein